MIKCKYLFYIKAGSSAGLGHLRRSLAIASGLKEKGKSVCFLVKGDDTVIAILKKKGFKAFRFSRSAFGALKPSTAVIDQKDDVSSEIKELHSKGTKTCLIDNATKARLISDVVIYPVAHFDAKLNWKGFRGKKYVGPEYFPLNKEFLKTRPVKHKIFTILVTMGGSDPNGLTAKAAKALSSMDGRFKALIVIGPGFKKRNIAEDKRFKIIRDPKNIAGLMASSDLAITAFGTTLYELAHMGIPALIISNFQGDEKDCLRFVKFRTAINLGYHEKVSAARISGTISKLMSAKKKLIKMSKNGKKLVDGKGAAKIVKILKGLST